MSVFLGQASPSKNGLIHQLSGRYRPPTSPLGCRTTRRPTHVFAAPRAAKTPVWQPRCPIPKNSATKLQMALGRIPQNNAPEPEKKASERAGAAKPAFLLHATHPRLRMRRTSRPSPTLVNRKRPPAFRGRALFIPKTSPLGACPLPGRYLYWLGCFAKKSKRGGSSRMRWRASVISPALHSSSMFSKS